MAHHDDQTYDDTRAENLRAMLRALAAQIVARDTEGQLLASAGELMQLIGTVRSELFHYEVRCTYDTRVDDTSSGQPRWQLSSRYPQCASFCL